MKAFVIDPAELNITQVDFDGDYRSVYRLIGCETFDMVRLRTIGTRPSNTPMVYVDSDGLLKPGPRHYFRIAGYGAPLCGKALLAAHDLERDETVDSLFWLTSVQAMVQWVVPDIAESQIAKGQEDVAARMRAAGLEVTRLGTGPFAPVMGTPRSATEE